MQNILGLSPIAAGVRFLPLTGAIFLTAGAAGRLTSHVPRRLLIGPGFALIGAGLVNVPLVSTAVGVVEPARAGMASGINSTLRQVGIATGVAGLGTIFATHVRAAVTSQLAGTALAARAAAIAHAISTGGAARAIATAPRPLGSVIAAASRSSFIGGLDLILLIGAVVAFAAGAASFVLVRERDFVTVTDLEAEPVAAVA